MNKVVLPKIEALEVEIRGFLKEQSPSSYGIVGTVVNKRSGEVELSWEAYSRRCLDCGTVCISKNIACQSCSGYTEITYIDRLTTDSVGNIIRMIFEKGEVTLPRNKLK